MAIPESQLETWSHKGSVKQSSSTYTSIKEVLENPNSRYSNRTFKVFLQGSYGNDTNIYAESDVDVVIRLDSIFNSNIRKRPKEEQEAYDRTFSDATYSLKEFKNEVLKTLVETFGDSVKPGNKAIKITPNGSRRSADVIVCCKYRNYKPFSEEDPDNYKSGVTFFSGANRIINYPELHSKNLTAQHQETGCMLKPMVRILKNMRSQMVDEGLLRDGTAPSYYLEGLFYNVPKEEFVSTSYGDTLCNGINWLLKADRTKLVCANWQYDLLGDSQMQWNTIDCDAFLDAVCKFWKEWS